MKEDFFKWIVVAKNVVYDKQMADQYLPLLQSRGGAVTAVLNVISALEQQREIPGPMKPILAVNIYLMMVDVAMNASDEKPSKEAMMETIKAIMGNMGGQQQPQAPAAPAAPQAPQGMLAMGGA